MRTNSRTLFSISAICLILLFCIEAHAEPTPSWDQYKALFISSDGRVLDYGQGQVTTSEGQGYGMLLAISNDDRKTFDSLWGWTRVNIAVRRDNLMAWLWGRRPNGDWEVMDYNNATDGDTLIALALLRAAVLWEQDRYRHDALEIIRSMREKLVVRHDGKTFLLPGYYGFSDGDFISLNPSYMVLPAYRLFAEVDEKPFWDKLYSDSKILLRRACFGTPCLPADWIWLSNGDIEVDGQRSAHFGYDAVRIFLNLAWEHARMPEGLGYMLDLYKKRGYMPASVNLKTRVISKDSALAGVYAIYGLAAQRSGEPALARKLFDEASARLLSEDRNYYSYSLYLLTLAEAPF